MTPLNLWSPQAGMPILAALTTSYLLGVVHGITPDEHTWPITFSYAIGSYSARRGFLVGLVFSLAFTLQRSLMSELAYFSLVRIFTFPKVEGFVYIVVGVAMAVGGLYIFRSGNVFHIHFGRIDSSHHQAAVAGTMPEDQTPTLKMAAVHGFIAGFGFGAFAMIIYTVLAPAMPGPWAGWLPGFLFGLGTTTVQILAGLAFGQMSHSLRLPPEAAARIAGLTAGRSLTWGGLVFFLGGIMQLLVPSLAKLHIVTPLKIHNLHELGLPFVLVITVVLFIGGGTMVAETRRVMRTIAGNAGPSGKEDSQNCPYRHEYHADQR
ncbi:MAG: sulfite exporter TauE/SafE family protein [Peptococcaceae bacterium]|jgi:sulfite exporter TauE/SafE|nr:sulfite exporter TauE/SafE family protein [Peptococcaceae bacterium]